MYLLTLLDKMCFSCLLECPCRLYNFLKVDICQIMQKNRQIVLQNPFHPLDLSPHDLLAIYKRFQQSRLINRNPKQQLPIQTIAQLISSLKGCTPSYIQRCISQALIKQTISWNQFLTFLDQESEVREKILEWLMYEKSTIKYREEREWPFRAKIGKFFEEITFLKFVELTENEKVIICSIDKMEYYLFSQNNGKIHIIDRYINKSEKIIQEKPLFKPEEEHISNASINNSSKIRKIGAAQISRSLQRHQRQERERAITSMVNSSSKGPQLALSRDEQEAFYRKQRKNINSLFNVFKDLSLDNSVTYAKLVSQKLSEKNMNPAQISLIRDTFTGLQQDRNLTEKKLPHGPAIVKPLEKAKTILRQLHYQKRVLSYNPYAVPKRDDFSEFDPSKLGKLGKRVGKQRKQPEYNHLANHEVYCGKLRCLAIVYFNMQLVLIKLQREYNKISLEYQDKLKIFTENQHKKNEVIEGIDFYYHSIVDKWFLIVLIRVEYKNQTRNQNESYIRGYELELIERKARLDKGYRFKNPKKETFSMGISHPDRYSPQEMVKHEIFNMQMQVEHGIHFISVAGRYVSFKEDYIEGKNKHEEAQYFTFHHEERFKNAGLSLSCLSVGLQLNKIIFGTIRGVIIIYDMFSHLFKVKKVSSSQISQIRVVGSEAYILTLDEKLILFDLVKIEQVQHLNVRNESKLHQKVKRFELNRNILYFYGTEVRSYGQYVDEKLLHEHRKMQTIYKWRLDKLFKEQASFKKQNRHQAKELKALLPANAVAKESGLNIQMVIQSQNYFLVLTEILELIVVDKKSLRIKFTMILDVPHDSKVMRMAISMNEKLLALLLFNQNIYIFNIHTQDLYQTLRPAPFLKYTSLCFLDSKNEFLLACGTESGKLILSPYNSIPEKTPKLLEFHRKSITALVITKKEYLVSCGEDLLITIWLLPFNILKHEIKLQADVGYGSQQIGCFKQLAYLRTLEGYIVQINAHEGKLLKILRDHQGWSCSAVDSCTGQLLGINNNSNLQILIKGKEGWTLKTRVTIEQLKNQIKWLGVVESEKAVIFLDSGMILPWVFQTEKLGKGVNLCQE